MPSRIPHLLLLLAGAGGLAAPAPALVQAELDEALVRGLETISVDEMKADLAFLADDQMAGRDTPSPELRVAARFIRARLQRLGFAPGAADGYLWEWSCPQLGMDLDKTWLRVTGADGAVQTYSWGSDYFLTPRAEGLKPRVRAAMADPSSSGEGR